MKTTKKKKSITASGLAEVTVHPIGEDSVSLLLTDTRKKTTGYMINPEGLNAVLEPLLGLAARWAHLEDLSIDRLAGPRQALPASRVVLEKGRNVAECALRVFVGKVELTFLIPLKEVIEGMAAMVPMIEKVRMH